MVYADVEYYTNDWLLGRAAVISIKEFPFWERKARERINWRKVELAEVPEYLANCTCEVAEALFLASERQFMGMTPSQSVGQFSKGATVLQPQSQSIESEIQGIVQKWLVNTSLHNTFVFRG